MEPLHRPSKSLLAAAGDWSEAVWDSAMAVGPADLGNDRIARGLALARRPVFICGVHRSGTSLLLDLLDGHRQLSVLPSEGSYLTSLRRTIARLPDAEQLKFLGCEWIRRLANPTSLPPYWLLGRTTEERAPYVLFARHLIAWWPELRRTLSADFNLWPHLAMILAYTSAVHRGDASVLRWVDKTPTNEFYLRQLRNEFSDARVIHVVRDPTAVFASRKRLEVQTFGRFASAGTVLREMRRSYTIASRQLAAARSTSRPFRRPILSFRRKPGWGGYRVIRYEDLVREARNMMEAIAAFLEIDMDASLLRPTVAGMAASANSSFGSPDEPGTILSDTGNTADELSTDERRNLRRYVGKAARVFGYEVGTS